MSLPDTWRLDATELASKIQARELSPNDIVDEALRRTELFDSRLRIFAHLDKGGARKAADAATERQRAGNRLSALDGVPVTIKDNLFVKGMPARWGSRLFEAHVAPHDDIVVERLRATGAVILGKTATPEFALSGRTQSPITGVTRNPWDPNLTPGGSSGGAMAALATGIAPLAIGTDAGGSIRTPASYTGMIGLRPSNGRVPRRQCFPPTALDFQAIGLATRTMRDMILLYGMVSGPDVRDPASLHLPREAVSGKPSIGWFASIGGEHCDPEVTASVASRVARLAELGYDIQPTEAPFDLVELRQLWDVISSAAVVRILAPFGEGWRELVTDPIRELAERGLRRSAADYVRAMDQLSSFRARVSVSWGSFDLIVTPTTPAPAWPASLEAPKTIGNRPGTGEAMGMFCGWVNAIGLPAISIPADPHPDGRPIGVQIVGQYGADQVVLDLASCWEGVEERASGGRQSPSTPEVQGGTVLEQFPPERDGGANGRAQPRAADKHIFIDHRFCSGYALRVVTQPAVFWK